MKGIQPVDGIHPRTISSIARTTGTSQEEVSRAARGEGKRTAGKPNLRLEARLERAQRGFR